MSSPAAPRTRTVRYVRTSALTRVLDPVDARSVVQVNAIRSIQQNSAATSAIPYLRYSDREIRSLNLDYDAFRYGPFDKSGVLDSVEKTVGEAVIQTLDLILPQEFSEKVGEAAGSEPAKSTLARHKYVAHLAHYPCSREGEKNQFWADVDDFMTEEEKQWMERGSLDLEYFMPAEPFRDITLRDGRVGSDFGALIEEWKERTGSNPPLVRSAFEILFPDPDMRQVREYRWDKQDKWLLSRVGEL